jgi:uncharacterized protein (DUF362 family)
MTEESSRREFLVRTAKAGLAVAASGGLGLFLHNRAARRPQWQPSLNRLDLSVPQASGSAQMVVARGARPATITRAAIRGLGGMSAFISRQDIVVIKPNIAWDRVPEQAANSNPEVVRALVEMCYEAGAKEVRVTDVSCDEPRRCFQRSGIAAAAQDVGARVILPQEQQFREVALGGEVLDRWLVFRPFLEADKIINVPIAKHHGLTGVTLALKNWYGILGGPRHRLHQRIHESLADLAMFMKPTLTVLDAVRVLVRNGPQGGRLTDVREMNLVVASVDQVAVDAFGVTLFGYQPADFRYLLLAESRGLGTTRFEDLKLKEISV